MDTINNQNSNPVWGFDHLTNRDDIENMMNQQYEGYFSSGATELMKSYMWSLAGFLMLPVGFGLIAGPLGMVNARKAGARGRDVFVATLMSSVITGVSLVGVWPVSLALMSFMFDSGIAGFFLASTYATVILLIIGRYIKKTSPIAKRQVTEEECANCNSHGKHNSNAQPFQPREVTPRSVYDTTQTMPPVQDVVRRNYNHDS